MSAPKNLFEAAAARAPLEVWQELITEITENGMDVNEKNAEGKNALQLYLTDNQEINQEVVKELLREHAETDCLTPE